MTNCYNYITITHTGGRQMKYLNYWTNIMIGVFGGVILSNLYRLSDTSIFPQLHENVFLWLSIIIVLIAVFLLVFKFIIRKAKPRFEEDERERAVSDRSARNGLLVTYLTLLILLSLEIPLDAKSLLIVVAAGLFVWMVSSIFYYYKKA